MRIATVVVLAAAVTATPLAAQKASRFELTPIVGFQFGGGFTGDLGRIELKESVSYGGALSFRASWDTWIEATYLRQDTDATFNPIGGGTPRTNGAATNYIHGGVRQDFTTGGPVTPFILGSLGATIFDSKAEGQGSETYFSFGLGAGVKSMFGASKRVGARIQGRWWATSVPSGSSVWCDPFFGCYSVGTYSLVSQGELSGGLTIAF